MVLNTFTSTQGHPDILLDLSSFVGFCESLPTLRCIILSISHFSVTDGEQGRKYLRERLNCSFACESSVRSNILSTNHSVLLRSYSVYGTNLLEIFQYSFMLKAETPHKRF